ncbi:hypothetical protein Tco_1473325 [Tanacetum coccineum]
MFPTSNFLSQEKKGEYDIWAMKMEHYLAHTDYPIWEVIQNGNGPVSITTDTQGQIKVLPPRTAEEILARERERKARTTLLMALPEDHLAKFHKMTDAKEMWEAIKSRFGGNDESKKMQKFQSLLSQLEIHGVGVLTDDANQKFLRSLPSAWSQVSLIMSTKPGVDSLSFDDLYNNLRVFENEVKGSTAPSSSTQNVAFISENTSSANDVAMISIRMKKFYKKTGHFARECKTKGNKDSKRRDAWNSGNKDGRRSGKQEDSKYLVTIDGEGVDWTSHSEEEEDYALMACNSSGSDTENFQVMSNISKLSNIDEQYAHEMVEDRFVKTPTEFLRAAALSNEWGFCLLKRSSHVWIVTGGGFSPESLNGPIPSRNSSRTYSRI